MALASAIKSVDITRRRKRRTLAITPSGNYVAGGDTLDLTKTTNPNYFGAAGFSGVPQDYTAKNAPGGFTGEFIPGATLQTCKVKYYASDGTEVAAGAYPAALAADPTLIELSSQLWSEN